MKVLVTGVGGQLGHDVMNELNRRGHEGIGTDLAPAYAGLQGHVRIVALPDRYVYDASPQLVYGIKKMANAAYGKELFPPEPEELLKGY